jgi:hypothetical protein
MRPTVLLQLAQQQLKQQADLSPVSDPTDHNSSTTPPPPLPQPPIALGCHLFGTTISQVPHDIVRDTYQAELEHLRTVSSYHVDLFEQVVKWNISQLAQELVWAIPELVMIGGTTTGTRTTMNRTMITHAKSTSQLQKSLLPLQSFTATTTASMDRTATKPRNRHNPIFSFSTMEYTFGDRQRGRKQRQMRRRRKLAERFLTQTAQHKNKWE